MVLKKTPTSSEYDDLDAINDFIRKACNLEDSKATISSNVSVLDITEASDTDKTLSLSTDESDSLCDKSKSFRKVCEKVPVHIHHYRTPFSAPANDFLAVTNQSGKPTDKALPNRPTDEALEEREYSTHDIEKQIVVAVNPSEKTQQDQNGVITLDRSVINRRNNDNKCIFSKSNKVLLCDIIKIGHKNKNFRKQFRPANKFELGNIKVSYNPVTQILPIENREHSQQPESREVAPVREPILSLMGALNKIKVKHEAVGSHLGDIKNTFLIGSTDSTILIDKAQDYLDFSTKELYDLIVRMTGPNTRTDNYTRLTEDTLICYNHEPSEIKRLKNDDAYFILPTDRSMCYIENHRVRLKGVTIYLLKGESMYTRNWFLCRSVINRADLYDITNEEILNVSELGGNYNISIKDVIAPKMILVPNLDLILYRNGKYHWYRMKNIYNYLKWITAIQLRCRE